MSGSSTSALTGVELPLLRGTSVTKLDDCEVSGVAPPPPRRRKEGSSADPNMTVSDLLDLRRSFLAQFGGAQGRRRRRRLGGREQTPEGAGF